MSKGSRRRPQLVGDAEATLRWDFAFGRITKEEFDRRYKQLDHEGKITRGRLRITRGLPL